MKPTNTVGGGIDQNAVIGHAPEARGWMPGDPAFAPLIAESARIEAFATVDAGLHAPTRVEAGAWLMKHAHVGHDARIGAHAEICTGAIIGGHAQVNQYAKVGIGAVILPFRVIGANATVGAGAVVTRDVPANATVAGNPARIITPNEVPHTQRTQEERVLEDDHFAFMRGSKTPKPSVGTGVNAVTNEGRKARRESIPWVSDDAA